ncbi:phosphoadenosine phosphosulfate reductase [Jannaschia ovalis]|uniref:Phosphoadenosine phosphosulfate reductase n=1 Tax=Jannaschia ovalis TaxID=3038773 RepID=A0ABY8LBZ5_9RHOB|nr:phosphoadenosine phosphosulfate reductase [Jannaschia sp. GRR-S6-38]WGH78851.1 phosphoadenosine phosphosulfate reductase [Jannaschia sp. GRR-S6-38]
MPDDSLASAGPALSRTDHRAALEAAAAGRDGELRALGDDHMVLRRSGNDTLLVSFEDLDQLRQTPGGLPWSTKLLRKRRWSTLTVMCDGRTWFRDPALYAYFDQLTDDGVFDDYARVIFAGGGIGAYAAGAYSVAAPGAIVCLVQPYATLDREVAPWEGRFRSSRALDFTSRYGNAAQMIEAAAQVYLITDPTRAADAMHASLFQGDHVLRLNTPHAGEDIWARLREIGILDRVVAMAGNGQLTRAGFAELWRRRRHDPGYQAGLMRKLDGMNRPWLTALLAGYILRNGENAAARRRLNDALVRLEEQGHAAPAGLSLRPRGAMLLAGE